MGDLFLFYQHQIINGIASFIPVPKVRNTMKLGSDNEIMRVSGDSVEGQYLKFFEQI